MESFAWHFLNTQLIAKNMEKILMVTGILAMYTSYARGVEFWFYIRLERCFG